MSIIQAIEKLRTGIDDQDFESLKEAYELLAGEPFESMLDPPETKKPKKKAAKRKSTQKKKPVGHLAKTKPKSQSKQIRVGSNRFDPNDFSSLVTEGKGVDDSKSNPRNPRPPVKQTVLNCDACKRKVTLHPHDAKRMFAAGSLYLETKEFTCDECKTSAKR